MTFLDNLPKPFFILAPMDDVTDTVFRQIITDLAKPDLFFTEFVNVDGLQSPGRPKLIHKLMVTEKEKPVIAQIWGLKPDNFYKTTKDLLDMGFAGVDINMGCPVKTIVKNGACAALINNRELAGKIIDAVQAAADESQHSVPFPVSVKTRVGFTTVDFSWIEYILNKKLNLLSIHTRTAAQMSNVPADWKLLDPIKQMRDSLSPNTLLVGNGDVETRSQAEDLAKIYQLDGIMVGRGIFNNPFLFAKQSPWKDWTSAMKIDLYKKHIELHLNTYKQGERRFETLRKFCNIYINGFDGAADVRAKFMEKSNPDQALALLNSIQEL